MNSSTNHSGIRKTSSELLRRNLRFIYGDGLAFSMMVGLGETYVPAFALSLGMSEVSAGWIVSVPMLIGAILQLVSPAAVRRLGSHRRWVVLCAFLQASSLFAFVVEAMIGRLPEALVFLVASLYWGTGLATGPAWNTWVGALVPKTIRARFFARRSRSCQAAILIGTVTGGLCLHWAPGSEVLFVFAGLFLAAGLFRCLSVGFLLGQSEDPVPKGYFRDVSLSDLLAKAKHGADGRLLVYMLAVQISVQVVGPFFTPYMLAEIQFSYLEYLLLIATAFGAKTLAFPLAGLLARRLGSQTLLYASGIGIVPLSALWIFSDSLGYLLCLQVVGGTIWAGYELATFLLLFERIDESERTSVLTVFNAANATALLVGSLMGGLLLKALGQNQAAYYVIFGLSGLLRLVTVLLLARMKHVTFSATTMATRTVAVRPNTGSIGAPIVSSVKRAGGSPK